MAHSVDDWLSVLQQVMPRGPAWSNEASSPLARYLRGYARRLQRAEANADRLLDEMRPQSTIEMLPEWEQYLGLPECGTAPESFVQRRAAVVEKYGRRLGLAIWQIEMLAARLGYQIEVRVNYPHHCQRSCVYPLHPEADRMRLHIHIYGVPDAAFTVLDTVNTPLMSDEAGALQCGLERYQLAGADNIYYYEV